MKRTEGSGIGQNRIFAFGSEDSEEDYGFLEMPGFITDPQFQEYFREGEEILLTDYLTISSFPKDGSSLIGNTASINLS